MTKPSKSKYLTAVALEYEEHGTCAPVVSVKSGSVSADEIVKIAKRFGVPVVEKPELAEPLKQVEIYREIPKNLFEAVAILLHQISKRY